MVIANSLVLSSCGGKDIPEPNTKKINDGPIEVGKFSEYDLDTWMRPLWEGRVIHNESVMLTGIYDKAKLLHKPDEILGVKDYSLTKDYIQGVDYEINDNGEISLTQKTSIDYMSSAQYYSHNNAHNEIQIKTEINGVEKDLWFSEEIFKHQINITYTHSEFWDYFIPETRSDQFARLIKKLENGEDVTFIFYGDSITYGASATGMIPVSPFTPIWSVMFTNYIAKQYQYTVNYINAGLQGTIKLAETTANFGSRGKITYINSSVGGWCLNDGIVHYKEYVKNFIQTYGCDLYVQAFTMNDGGGHPVNIKNNTEKLLNYVYTDAPNVETLLVSTMVPNPDIIDSGFNMNQPLFEKEFLDLAEKYQKNNTHCAVSPMTSMSESILTVKRFRDYTGNNINHPNDFMARLYAQVAYKTIFKK